MTITAPHPSHRRYPSGFSVAPGSRIFARAGALARPGHKILVSRASGAKRNETRDPAQEVRSALFRWLNAIALPFREVTELVARADSTSAETAPDFQTFATTSAQSSSIAIS